MSEKYRICYEAVTTILSTCIPRSGHLPFLPLRRIPLFLFLLGLTFFIWEPALAWEPVEFNGGQFPVSGQAAGTWQHFRVIVPAGALGWDLRIEDVTSGRPIMVVRRDQEATSFTTTQGIPPGYGSTQVYTYNSNSWPSGWTWAPGLDWTDREFSAGGVSQYGQVLAMGMGSPLEPGTYYVGVSNHSSDTSAMSYRFVSRGIGLETETDPVGNPWAIPIGNLAFNAATPTDVGILQPRDVAYYRVVVPAGMASWSLKLGATSGEGLVAIRKDSVPNIRADKTVSSDATYYFQGTKRSKTGGEVFYKYPPEGASSIPFGVYYVAVVSEGTSPPDADHVGSGASDFTIQSTGPVPVTDLTASTLPLNITGQNIPYGEQRVYRFRVLSGPAAVEVRLRNRTGNPRMWIHGAAVGQSRIPGTSGLRYRADEGGHTALVTDPDVITVPLPAGDYSVVVAAADWGLHDLDAAFDMEITASQAELIQFNMPGAENVQVTNQEARSWKYFRVVVPDDGTLTGWDVRIESVTSGRPRMVVSRESPVASYSVGSQIGCYSSSWPQGAYWPAGFDWTGRRYSATGEYEYGHILTFGMGSPLEPGTYYIGVTSDGTNTTPMSYQIRSRGVGTGGDWAIQVQDLDYVDGGHQGVLASPREAAYYRVVVPPGSESWALNLALASGAEAMMAIRHGHLPNIAAGANYLSDDYNANANICGAKRQKDGNEYFYKYLSYGTVEITPGEYYIAVVSEGNNPGYGSVGSGPISYSLNSDGMMPVSDMSSVPLDEAVPIEWPNEILPYGAQKVYRFQVPEGFMSMEVRLEQRAGNPEMALRSDTIGAGRIPRPYSLTYRANEGGDSYESWDAQVISIQNPVGEYTLTIGADNDIYGYGVTASYNVVVEVHGERLLDFNGGSVRVDGQMANSWRYYRVVVPASAIGWDLRLRNVSGDARMVVGRGVRPTSFSGPPVYMRNYWPDAGVWVVQDDYTGRFYSSSGQIDLGRVLVAGMGSPLSASDENNVDTHYYVGVSNEPSNASNISYTLESRGIGVGDDPDGSPWLLQVAELDFANGEVSSSTALAPREADYYRVNVPTGTASWSLALEPLDGEAMVAIRHGSVPNVAAESWAVSDGSQYQGTKRQKAGREFFYKYQAPGSADIRPGYYYIAVVGEGLSPQSSQHIGTGSVNYTLSSRGTVSIEDMTSAPLQANTPLEWPNQTLPDGDQRVYRFRVPSGFSSLEVRLRNAVGNPKFSIYQGAEGDGRIPTGPPASFYRADEGGEYYTSYGSAVVTLPEPSGDYTVVVSSDRNGNDSSTTAYSLEASVRYADFLDFNLGQTADILNQEAGSWRFFLVVVPSGPLGWELRMNVTSGTPRMVVSRDRPVPAFNTNYWGASGDRFYLYQSNWWPSGWSWAPELDWTGREYSATGRSEKGQVLGMGMGSPLLPGVYYVGISNDPSDASAMSYSLQSRGIGEGVPWSIQVEELAFSGGTSNLLTLGPRETAYYRVAVPQNASSWGMELQTSGSEGLMTVRKGTLGNIAADALLSSGDERYDEAVALIAQTRMASISMIQRRLRIGYNRAARIIERMEKEGIVGPSDGVKPREVLIKRL